MRERRRENSEEKLPTWLKFPCTQIYQHHQTDFEAFEDWAVSEFNCTLFVIIKNGMHCFCHPLIQALQWERESIINELMWNVSL